MYYGFSSSVTVHSLAFQAELKLYFNTHLLSLNQVSPFFDMVSQPGEEPPSNTSNIIACSAEVLRLLTGYVLMSSSEMNERRGSWSNDQFTGGPKDIGPSKDAQALFSAYKSKGYTYGGLGDLSLLMSLLHCGHYFKDIHTHLKCTKPPESKR